MVSTSCMGTLPCSPLPLCCMLPNKSCHRSCHQSHTQEGQQLGIDKLGMGIPPHNQPPAKVQRIRQLEIAFTVQVLEVAIIACYSSYNKSQESVHMCEALVNVHQTYVPGCRTQHGKYSHRCFHRFHTQEQGQITGGTWRSIMCCPHRGTYPYMQLAEET